MKKRVLSLVLSAIMITSLVGCNKTGGATSDTSSADAKTDSKNAGETSNELTVWCWDKAFNVYAMEEAAKVYQKDHPDFKLNVIETPWDDVQTKVITAATSGDVSSLPDILLMQDNAFQKNVISYPDLFMELDSSGIVFDDFSKAKTAYSIVNNKHYGVPFDNGAVIGAYRTDVLEEAGFKLDDFKDITWDDYLEKGKVVLEKTNKPLLSCVAGEVDIAMMMLQSAGGSLFDKEGKPAIVDNEILKETIQTYIKLKEAGVLLELNDWDQYVGSMTTGKVAGTVNGCWILASIQSAKDQSGKWGITNMPKLVKAKDATNYSNNGGSSWLVTANCKNKQLADDFLKSTFGSNVGFFETILPTSGALSTYIPAGKSDVYAKPQEFFAGQAIYKDITEFATKVPSNNTGVYYYEGREALSTAIQNIINGGDIDKELKAAQETVEFSMGK
jgi:hypothetical protein